MNSEEAETTKVVLHRKEIAAVKHFLQQNGLVLLKFLVSPDSYNRGRRMYYGTFPIYIRNYDDSSTIVYIEHFYYSQADQTLTVRVEELLKYL